MPTAVVVHSPRGKLARSIGAGRRRRSQRDGIEITRGRRLHTRRSQQGRGSTLGTHEFVQRKRGSTGTTRDRDGHGDSCKGGSTPPAARHLPVPPCSRPVVPTRATTSTSWIGRPHTRTNRQPAHQVSGSIQHAPPPRPP